MHLVVLEKTLESPLDSTEIKPVDLKGTQPEYSLEGLMLKRQYFGQLMWSANSLEKTLILGKTEGGRRRWWQSTRWWDGITDSMNMSWSKHQEMVKTTEVWCAAVRGVVKSQTWLSDWTTTNPRLTQASTSPSLGKWIRKKPTFLNMNLCYISELVLLLWLCSVTQGNRCELSRAESYGNGHCLCLLGYCNIFLMQIYLIFPPEVISSPA